MDNDLISRSAVRQRFENYLRDCEEAGDTVASQVFADCICELEAEPAVDAAQVVHGRWELGSTQASRAQYTCSVCGRSIMASLIRERTLKKYPYCHCGARMDGGEDDR